MLAGSLAGYAIAHPRRWAITALRHGQKREDIAGPLRRGDRGRQRFEFTTLPPLGERVGRSRRFLQPGRAG
jgi:hypothetical protein